MEFVGVGLWIAGCIWCGGVVTVVVIVGFLDAAFTGVGWFGWFLGLGFLVVGVAAGLWWLDWFGGS